MTASVLGSFRPQVVEWSDPRPEPLGGTVRLWALAPLPNGDPGGCQYAVQGVSRPPFHQAYLRPGMSQSGRGRFLEFPTLGTGTVVPAGEGLLALLRQTLDSGGVANNLPMASPRKQSVRGSPRHSGGSVSPRPGSVRGMSPASSLRYPPASASVKAAPLRSQASVHPKAPPEKRPPPLNPAVKAQRAAPASAAALSSAAAPPAAAPAAPAPPETCPPPPPPPQQAPQREGPPPEKRPPPAAADRDGEWGYADLPAPQPAEPAGRAEGDSGTGGWYWHAVTARRPGTPGAGRTPDSPPGAAHPAGSPPGEQARRSRAALLAAEAAAEVGRRRARGPAARQPSGPAHGLAARRGPRGPAAEAGEGEDSFGVLVACRGADGAAYTLRFAASAALVPLRRLREHVAAATGLPSDSLVVTVGGRCVIPAEEEADLLCGDVGIGDGSRVTAFEAPATTLPPAAPQRVLSPPAPDRPPGCGHAERPRGGGGIWQPSARAAVQRAAPDVWASPPQSAQQPYRPPMPPQPRRPPPGSIPPPAAVASAPVLAPPCSAPPALLQFQQQQQQQPPPPAPELHQIQFQRQHAPLQQQQLQQAPWAAPEPAPERAAQPQLCSAEGGPGWGCPQVGPPAEQEQHAPPRPRPAPPPHPAELPDPHFPLGGDDADQMPPTLVAFAPFEGSPYYPAAVQPLPRESPTAAFGRHYRPPQQLPQRPRSLRLCDDWSAVLAQRGRDPAPDEAFWRSDPYLAHEGLALEPALVGVG